MYLNLKTNFFNRFVVIYDMRCVVLLTFVDSNVMTENTITQYSL